MEVVCPILDDSIFAVLLTHLYFTYGVPLSYGFVSRLAGILPIKYFQRRSSSDKTETLYIDENSGFDVLFL